MEVLGEGGLPKLLGAAKGSSEECVRAFQLQDETFKGEKTTMAFVRAAKFCGRSLVTALVCMWYLAQVALLIGTCFWGLGAQLTVHTGAKILGSTLGVSLLSYLRPENKHAFWARVRYWQKLFSLDSFQFTHRIPSCVIDRGAARERQESCKTSDQVKNSEINQSPTKRFVV